MDISLALGGGGARGNAHIGVLRVLEREGFRVRAIAGTSFGGLVACFYAAGFSPDEIQRVFAAVDQTRMYDRERTDRSSLFGLSRVSDWLDETLGPRRLEDLKIPCAVTAVDLATSNEVVITKGSVRDAILATIALPGIFPSFLSEALELVDGGLLDPVPIGVARSLAPALPVVAVSLTTPLGKPPRAESIAFFNNMPRPLGARFNNSRVAKTMEAFVRSMDIGGRQIAELQFKIAKPEVLIHPEVDDIGVLDQVSIAEVALLGEEAARLKMPELRRAASWASRLRRHVFRASM